MGLCAHFHHFQSPRPYRCSNGTIRCLQASDESFFTFMEDKIGAHYFCRFVQDVDPVHGNFLLQCGRYRSASHERRAIAQELCDTFVNVVSQIWSGEDPDTIIEAYRENKKPIPNQAGKKSSRQNNKMNKVNEAKKIVEEALERLQKRTAPDLLDEMFRMLKEDLDVYFPEFKKSKWMEQYARARSMETQTVSEDDFHQFRVLGVGGFGAVHAAVKKDTGALLAIKRMDKKLIKHKDRCALRRTRPTKADAGHPLVFIDTELRHAPMLAQVSYIFLIDWHGTGTSLATRKPGV